MDFSDLPILLGSGGISSILVVFATTYDKNGRKLLTRHGKWALSVIVLNTILQTSLALHKSSQLSDEKKRNDDFVDEVHSLHTQLSTLRNAAANANVENYQLHEQLVQAEAEVAKFSAVVNSATKNAPTEMFVDPKLFGSTADGKLYLKLKQNFTEQVQMFFSVGATDAFKLHVPNDRVKIRGTLVNVRPDDLKQLSLSFQICTYSYLVGYLPKSVHFVSGDSNILVSNIDGDTWIYVCVDAKDRPIFEQVLKRNVDCGILIEAMQ